MSKIDVLSIANFSDITQYNSNKSSINTDSTIALMASDSFSQWHQAYTWDGVTKLENRDTPDPHKAICTLPANWKACYVVFNYGDDNARNIYRTNSCLLTQKNQLQTKVGYATAFIIGDDNILRGYSVNAWSFCLKVYYLV